MVVESVYYSAIPSEIIEFGDWLWSYSIDLGGLSFWRLKSVLWNLGYDFDTLWYIIV